MEIYGFTDKKFKIIVSNKLTKLQENTMDSSTKPGKQYMNKCEVRQRQKS